MWADRQGSLEVGVARHNHEVLHVLQPRRQRLEYGNEVRVNQHHLVAGVIDNVGKVIGRKAYVGGVGDRAHGGRGEVRFQVPVGVPPESAYPVALAHAEASQRVAQPVHPPLQVLVGITVNPVAFAGDDFLLREIGIGPVQQPRNQ